MTPKNKIDLVGKRFGRLVVLKEGRLHRTEKSWVRYWICKCDCGNIVEVRGQSLRHGLTKSCGCLHKELLSRQMFKDLTGKKFGRLTVIKLLPERNNKNERLWLCKCECGNTKILPTRLLNLGNIKSCGCLHEQQKKKFSTINKKHGMCKSNLYVLWKSIKARCCNPNNKEYKNYGGRGITICEEWKNNFELFRDWALKNGYVDGLSIDRIDNNGPYAPWNCQFISVNDNKIKRTNTLTPQQVYDIFIYCAAFSNKTLHEIAKEFNVSVNPVSKIKRGKHPRMLDPKTYVWEGQQKGG